MDSSSHSEVIPIYDSDFVYRFWTNINLDDAQYCWGWKYTNNYGTIVHQGNRLKAHVVSWCIANDLPRKPSLEVRHRCDNPPCCNPNHLILGTRRENAMDAVERGRHHNATKTHCPANHEYTKENTYINAKGHRVCRKCNNNQHQAKE